jgi:hypothetical protein
MAFNLTLEFIGLCALAKKADDKELHILLPDARATRLSHGEDEEGTVKKKRFYSHNSYVAFKFSDLDPAQSQDLDGVSSDDTFKIREGFLILHHDLLEIDYTSTTDTLNFDESYVEIPHMDKIYHDAEKVSINPRLITEPPSLDNGIVARMVVTKGTVFGDDRAPAKFKFTGRPDTADVNDIYNDGVRFRRKVVVKAEVTSPTVDLKLGDKVYKFSPSDGGGQVRITIANMPIDRIAGSMFPLTVLDDTKEDYDFELVYAVTGSKPAGKPRVPKKKLEEPPPPPPGTLPFPGTTPPLICAVAIFSDIHIIPGGD